MRRASIAMAIMLVTISGVMFSLSSTENPHGNLKWDCQDCHTPESWTKLREPMNFNHDQTGFHLAGAHSQAQCIGCHKDLTFSHVGTACVDCHSDHHQGQLGLFCQNCHTAKDWSNRKDLLELHSQRGFALTGVHAVADCEACHRGYAQEEFAGAPVDCMGCHAETYARTTNPSHMETGFSSNCEQCHHAASGTWKNATYVHKTFVLTGAHRSLECNSCHAGGYTAVSTACWDCHSQNYLGTTDPNHAQNGFNHNCVICHTTTSFRPASYNHNATSFPLTGKHASVPCSQCHTNPNSYAGTPTDCYSCHQAKYEGVSDPNHVLANFNHDCTTCHTTNGWTPSSFNHASTGYTLTGAHIGKSCSSCHATAYAGTPTDCYSCHQTNYEGVSDPNHVTNNFDHDCTTCHSTTAWSPSTFNHSSTAFSLSGAHINTSCISCHGAGYANTPTDCYSCHQPNYESVTDPNHATNNFSHDCTSCHSTTAWSPASFNHAGTAFPLTGAHVSVACISCHAAGYTNTPTDCYACHQSNYDATTQPSHTSANFPTTCLACHTTTAWVPSTWNHDAQYFPIYSGRHAGVWGSNCATCHVNTADYSVFECIDCHTHNKTDTAGHHSGVRNYQYLSTACYNCHPQGRP